MERRSTQMMVIRILIALPLAMSSYPPHPVWSSNEQSGGDIESLDSEELLLLLPSDSPPLSRMFDPEGRTGGPHPNESMTGMPPGDHGIPAGGMHICDMLLQSPEPPPFNQVPWFCVCSHCKGQNGPKGHMGDRGLPGRPGSPGRRGLMGYRGRPGFTGTMGIKGQKGDEGEKGSMGIMGMQGSKGGRGYKGDKGDHGVEGPPGLMGPQGEDGNCPASCTTIPGPPGLAGLQGRPGYRGNPGINGVAGPKGAKGDMGDMGRPGSEGQDGPKGDQGEKGICDCEDGTAGSPGHAGDPGSKGEQGSGGPMGDHGLDGPKGDLGPMGLMGPMGPPGMCTPRIQSGFTAKLFDSYPRPNFPIAFPIVLCCDAGMMHFNPMTGMYIAPVNGTYVFSYHLAVQGKVLKVGLFRNFAPMIKTTEANNMATASGQVTLHLKAKDRVWLQAKDAASNGLYTDPEKSSTFSGYLLYPDSCSDVLGFRDGDSVLDYMDPDSEEEGMVYSWEGPPSTTTTQPQTTTE